MVGRLGFPLLLGEAARVLERSDKARLLTAFLATLALSTFLLLVVWACARITRRYMNPDAEPVSTPLPEEDAWRLKPLVDNSELESGADADGDS